MKKYKDPVDERVDKLLWGFKVALALRFSDGQDKFLDSLIPVENGYQVSDDHGGSYPTVFSEEDINIIRELKVESEKKPYARLSGLLTDYYVLSIKEHPHGPITKIDSIEEIMKQLKTTLESLE